ncbi:MAG TPA: CBS domain-containing protein [Gemmataceae bacterium]
MICPSCGHDNVPGSDTCARCLTDLAPLDRPEGQDRVERSLMRDAVLVLKPPAPVTLPLGATLGEAAAVLTEADIGAVLVVDADGRLRGILTERDFLTEVALIPDYTGLPVSQFMTPDPETVAPTDTLAFALRKMDVGGYRHLPVVSEGMPVGMISVRDVIRHITRLCRHR